MVAARLVMTPGEPAGIGPDIALYAAVHADDPILVVASIDLLRQRANLLGVDIKVNDYSQTGRLIEKQLNILPVDLAASVIPGKATPANAAYVIETLEQAVRLCEQGECSAMVTGPVNKAVINDAGMLFTGHTEWLATRTKANQVVMMLATEGLKVALVTTHLPLRAVPDTITADLLKRTISTLHSDLVSKFGIADPRIVVLGLNPHAGESGHLGTEEIDVIAPVVRELSGTYKLQGPLPADTAFTPHILDQADVVLAMYHDQGLPVLKYKGFGAAANITLGLDIIRTSVDHGTALDIAGSGRADPASLMTAIAYAATMSAHGRK